MSDQHVLLLIFHIFNLPQNFPLNTGDISQMAESSSIYPAWPPDLSAEQATLLRSETNDWAQAHGLAVRSRSEWGLKKEIEEATCTTAPVTLFPSLLPRKQYDEAKRIQKSYNELYAKIASDVKWLSEVVNE